MVLKEEGCNVLEKIDESEHGKFAWVIDPEGNKVELWQPPQGQMSRLVTHGQLHAAIDGAAGWILAQIGPAAFAG